MKNLLTATMPALALLALGGCATSGALTTSTETDGVYYSSSDHTTTVASPASVAYGSQGTIPARALDDTTPVAATTDDANPDYQGGRTQGGYGTDYYSNSYNNGLSYYNPSGFNQPYTGPGVSTYNYAPAYGASPSYYGSPYGYSSAFGLGYSPFGYSPFMSYGYSPFGYGYPYGGGFYDPFYSPFGYGYGSGLSIGFGFGYGGFGGFGSPYGYGYSPFGYGSPYGYGYGRGYYDSYGYYGRPAVYAGRGTVAGPAYASPRVSRSGGSVFNGTAPANNGNVGGRPVGSYSPNSVAMPGGAAGGGVAMPTRRDGGGGGNIVGQPAYSTPASPAGSPSTNPRRGGFFGGFFGNGTNAGQNAATANPGGGQRGWSQPQYSNGQSQSQGQRRDFGGQPAYGGQPQQRTFSQPSQAQPSYSQPSRSFGGGSFGGGGGGGFGGGGGGGRRGGR